MVRGTSRRPGKNIGIKPGGTATQGCRNFQGSLGLGQDPAIRMTTSPGWRCSSFSTLCFGVVPSCVSTTSNKATPHECSLFFLKKNVVSSQKKRCVWNCKYTFQSL